MKEELNKLRLISIFGLAGGTAVSVFGAAGGGLVRFYAEEDDSVTTGNFPKIGVVFGILSFLSFIVLIASIALLAPAADALISKTVNTPMYSTATDVQKLTNYALIPAFTAGGSAIIALFLFLYTFGNPKIKGVVVISALMIILFAVSVVCQPIAFGFLLSRVDNAINKFEESKKSDANVHGQPGPLPGRSLGIRH